jgi:voltage-gated potassium channel
MHFWRHRFFHILHKPDPANPWALRVGVALAMLIVLNAAAVAIETVPGLTSSTRNALDIFEVVSTVIFFLEYILRLWVCVEQGHLARPIKGRLRYMAQPLVVLDLVVVLTHFLPVDLRFLRILRLVRLLRVLGLHQLENALTEIGQALRKRAQLLIAAVVLMVVAIYFSAALLFQIEHGAQPLVFTSIPATLWWAVVSLTTVGYGDMSPVTTLGKVFASAMLIFGIGIFALPTAIFTAAILDAGGNSDDSAK